MDMSYTLVLFTLMLLNVIFLLLKIPLLSFIFSIVTFSMCIMAFQDTDIYNAIIFTPYPQLATVFVALICLFGAGSLLRN